jgi:hypothetical protein
MRRKAGRDLNQRKRVDSDPLFERRGLEIARVDLPAPASTACAKPPHAEFWDRVPVSE